VEPELCLAQVAQIDTLSIAPVSLAGETHPAWAGSYGDTSISRR